MLLRIILVTRQSFRSLPLIVQYITERYSTSNLLKVRYHTAYVTAVIPDYLVTLDPVKPVEPRLSIYPAGEDDQSRPVSIRCDIPLRDGMSPCRAFFFFFFFSATCILEDSSTAPQEKW